MTEPKKFQIKIESILGGQSPTTHFAAPDQFRASLGIDPAQPISDTDGALTTIASGLLRPVASEKFSGTTITSAPLWLKTNPKDAYVYVLDANGSAYTIDATMTTVTALADGGTLTGGTGNGCEYYDNYLYFFKGTNVARYGPLNGAAAFDGDYWTADLALTALTNTVYPTSYKNSIRFPNHPACRHSDGKLYFGDVVGNRGAIHYVKTKFTTVEGDTNDVSAYNVLTLGYGLWPMALETYGSYLAVALYEGSTANLRQERAKIAFWDTVATNPDTIVWVEFPDTIITAMKNINGVLYVVSGNVNNEGFRVSKFLGGFQFQEVFYSETGEPCMQGAIDGVLNRILMGSHTRVPESDGCVYSVGLQKASLGQGLFNVMRSTGATTSTSVTAVCLADNESLGFYTPIIGWTQAGDGSTGVSHGLDKQLTTYSNAPSVWWSDLKRIGQPFKITKIRIPLAQAVAANMTVTPKIYFDDGVDSKTLTVINNTNYPGFKNIAIKPESATGQHNFWIELKWTGSALCTVGLPITFDVEILDD